MMYVIFVTLGHIQLYFLDQKIKDINKLYIEKVFDKNMKIKDFVKQIENTTCRIDQIKDNVMIIKYIDEKQPKAAVADFLCQVIDHFKMYKKDLDICDSCNDCAIHVAADYTQLQPILDQIKEAGEKIDILKKQEPKVFHEMESNERIRSDY